MAERDEACVGCGYSLSGLEEAVCPECGLDHAGLTAGAREWRMNWLSGVIGVWVFGGTMVLLGLGVLGPVGGSFRPVVWGLAIGAGCVGGGWAIHGGRASRESPGTGAAVAIGSWVLASLSWVLIGTAAVLGW